MQAQHAGPLQDQIGKALAEAFGSVEDYTFSMASDFSDNEHIQVTLEVTDHDMGGRICTAKVTIKQEDGKQFVPYLSLPEMQDIGPQAVSELSILIMNLMMSSKMVCETLHSVVPFIIGMENLRNN